MKRRVYWLLAPLALLIGLSACSAGLLQELNFSVPMPTRAPTIVSREPPASAFQTLAALEDTDIPQRDLVALAQRLRNAGEIPLVVRDAPYDYQVGAEEAFWVNNTDTNAQFQVTAVLQHITPHLYMWVEKGVEVDLEALRNSAELFETQTYPTNHRILGSEWSPGVDNDVHLNVLHVRGLGSTVGGFFFPSDEWSRLAHEYSNEREMFYVNLDTVQIGSSYYDGLLAHEFQHMIHWYTDRNEDLWLSEGLSELAAFQNGFDPGPVDASFLSLPDLQLNDFDYEINGAAHYGASYLFTLYFLEQFGEEATRALVAHPANGISGFTAVLEQIGQARGFEELFADWAVALYLDDPELDDGRFGFRAIDLQKPALAGDVYSFPAGQTATTVNQFASDYIRLNGTSPVTVVFTGTRQVPLLPAEPHGGEWFWWSNRGDDTDTTLTRAFDLSSLPTATLDYWLWYDIEEGWDYAYLEISTDDGRTWSTIRTSRTTAENPAGNNYGHGYTGRSGGGATPVWVHEQVDVSAFAGQPVLVRFEYITDGAIHQAGLALDDFSIPELGFEAGFEQDDPAWLAAGFIRNPNVLPQQFVIQLIELGDKPRVQRLPINEQGFARWRIPLSSDVSQAILIVSGITPVTLEPASYAFSIETDD